ncbi:MAG: ArnT family glycosyltransferase [Candidatus Polarisedimenticolia bacterium]
MRRMAPMAAARRSILSPSFMPLCLLLALGLRVAWVMSVDARPVDDFSWYHARAVDISQGLGLVDEGRPTAYWPAGYPMLLGSLYALFGASVGVAQIANIVMSLATILMTWRIGSRMLGSETAGRLAALLLALWPNQIAYVSLTATEIPFSFVLMLGILLSLRPGAGAGASLATGVVFGMATMIRPQAALLPAFLIVWRGLFARSEHWSWRSLRGAAWLHLGLALTLVPWTVRNYQVFGGFVFVANSGGGNLLIGNHPQATGGYGEVPGFPEVTDERAEDVLAARWATEYIVQHPGEALARIPFKLWHLYGKDVEGIYWNEVAMGRGDASPRQRPLYVLKLAAQAFYMGVMACALLSLVTLLRQSPPSQVDAAVHLTGWAVVAYFTLVFAVLFGSSRFHHPLAPWLGVYAASWLAGLVGVAQNASPRPAPVEAVAGRGRLR